MNNDRHKLLARPLGPSQGEAEINILDFAADEQGRGGARVLGRRLPAMVAQLLRAAGVSARHASATVPVGDEGDHSIGWAVPAGLLDPGQAIELSHRMGKAKLLAYGELGPPKKAGMTVKLRVLQREDAAEVLRFEKDFFEEEAADIALRLARELSQILPDGGAPVAELDLAGVLGASDPEALLRLQEGLDGLIAVEGGLQGADLAEAVNHLLGALQREPSRQAFDHALSAIANGSRDEELLGLEGALGLARQLNDISKMPEAALLLARLHRSRSELGAAKSTLEAAIAEHQGELTLVAELAQVLVELGLSEDAIEHIKGALKEEPSTIAEPSLRANLLEELGLALATSGELNTARENLKQAVALDDHRPRAWANLGRCHHLLGDQSAAREAYEKSLGLNPYGWEVQRNFAELLVEMGDLAEAEAQLTRWSERRPDDPLPMIAKAELLLSQNRVDEAIALLKDATASSPDDPRLHAMLGGVLTQTQDFERAEASYRQALRCSPDDPALMSNLALILSHRGDLSEAERFARRAVELDPSDSVSHRVLDHIRDKN